MQYLPLMFSLGIAGTSSLTYYAMYRNDCPLEATLFFAGGIFIVYMCIIGNFIIDPPTKTTKTTTFILFASIIPQIIFAFYFPLMLENKNTINQIYYEITINGKTIITKYFERESSMLRIYPENEDGVSYEYNIPDDGIKIVTKKREK